MKHHPIETRIDVVERVLIQVEPFRVKVNSVGPVWRDVMVRIPAAATADDLRDSRIWRRVQQQPSSALLQHDHLYIVAYDESWAATAIVKVARKSGASLVILKVFGFDESSYNDNECTKLYSECTMEVYFDGKGYGVRHRSNKIPVIKKRFSSEGQAIEALRKALHKEMYD